MNLSIKSATEQKAHALLELNWRKGYTIPSHRLYPFQWNWDAGFIALGWWYINPARAIEEINTMFSGQWKNGMLPHINFIHPDDNYFPGPEVWKTNNLAHGPSIPTSGITQPPVFGFILQRLHNLQQNKDDAWRSFLKAILPKVINFHRYLYTYRDPFNEGLVYIQHNWESGTDNSPLWDAIFENMDVSNAREVAHLRKDIKNVDAAERPTNENYKRYIHLVDLFAELQYNDVLIAKQSPFLVQDVLFNAMLVKSNLGIIALLDWLNEDATEIKQWNQKTINALNTKCWDEATGFYYAFDLNKNERINVKTSSGFMPLFAGVCNAQQAQQLIQVFNTHFAPSEQWKTCVSTAIDEPAFNPLKYWRGPAWINVNWMFYHGLKNYGFNALAERIKEDSLYLVEMHGMYEYFDARPELDALTARGIGADLFSWTAALYLDFIHNPQPL
ncbi:MAG: MGH1-like glycoside hydrolase domain-containing protein [Chitinophagaceae bacterium]